jgi:hypothetical protein
VSDICTTCGSARVGHCDYCAAIRKLNDDDLNALHLNDMEVRALRKIADAARALIASERTRDGDCRFIHYGTAQIVDLERALRADTEAGDG